MSKIHPFDFEKLRKGTWIDADELEEATTCKRTDPVEFRMRVLALRGLIEQRTGIIVRCEGDRLRLMTDSEALKWSIGQADEAGRRLERNARRLSESIDRGQLTDTEQVVHEHAVRVVSAMAESTRMERQRNSRLFALAPKQLTEDAE